MTRLGIRRALLVSALLLALAPHAHARRGVPPSIELDGCVLPSTVCGPSRDVVEMIVDDERRKFAVEAARFTAAGGSSSKLLAELKLRPLRVEGPKELTGKLVPGERRRVRGTLRLGPRYLLLQGVEPLGEGR
jgi:hypothetical protein